MPSPESELESRLVKKLVNIAAWCMSTLEVISQPRLNTANRHHRCDIAMFTNGAPATHTKFTAPVIGFRWVMQRVDEFKREQEA